MLRFDERSIHPILKIAKKYPVLSVVEERKLLKKTVDGNEKARETLIYSNVLFAVKVAQEYSYGKLPFEDVVMCAMEGLIVAVDKFDVAYENKFISYAVWRIRQVVGKALKSNFHAVHVPQGKVAEILKIKREVQKYETLNIPVDYEKMTEKLEVTMDQIDQAMALLQVHTSTDLPIYDDGGCDTLLDVNDFDDGVPTDDMAYCGELREELLKAIDEFPSRIQTIFVRYYGLDGKVPMSISEIGGIFGVTRQRISQQMIEYREHLKYNRALRELIKVA